MSTTTATLTEHFIEHGRYLRGWSDKTIRTYRQNLATLHAANIGPLTRASLKQFVVGLQKRGLTPGGINVRLRSINSFLTWLHEEGHTPDRVRVRLLPDPPKPITPISDVEIRRLLTFRPTRSWQRRTWTLVLLLLDTGLRLSEALGLDRDHVDLHNCLIRVRGKGNRERLVPISLECRKRLYVLLKDTTTTPVFATSSGRRVTSRNGYRAIKRTCHAAGVSGRHIHPHAFRHCFAVT
ncbi:MAG TPA: tyrosine-type recombinase/integrase [Vicinamibacterales bacterium]|nr:tyrosine-type recombinase/integrase [Vicinamibacterales bacterium]